MPNWCYQKLAVTGPEASITEFKARFMPGGKLSLNAIVPMPEALNITHGSHGEWGYKALYGDWESLARYPAFSSAPQTSRAAFLEWLRSSPGEREAKDSILRDGEAFHSNMVNYGHRTWYSWRVEHWGTKWEIGDNDQEILADESSAVELSFTTAWSPIIQALQALVMQDAELVFELDYLDEGGGFAGHFHLSDGHIEDDTRDWREHAVNVFGWTFDEEDEA